MSFIRKRTTLDMWIRDAMSDSDKDGDISAIAMVHMVNGQDGKEIHTVKFGPNKTYQPDQLASVFRGRAEAFAQDLPGVQTFELKAFYGTSTEPRAFQPFMVSGTLDNHGMGSETPDDRGHRAQQMRHSDAFFAQVFRRQESLDAATARVIEHQSKIIEMLGGQMATLQHENIEAFAVTRDLLLAQADKRHEYNMQQLEYQRKTKEKEQFLKLLPALVNGLTGKEIFPQGTQDTALIESIAESLDEKTAMRVAEILPPQMVGLLMPRLTEVLEKKEREKRLEEQRVKSLNEINPEFDAAGEPH